VRCKKVDDSVQQQKLMTRKAARDVDKAADWVHPEQKKYSLFPSQKSRCGFIGAQRSHLRRKRNCLELLLTVTITIFIHFHPFSSIFIHFHPFSSIFIHFHPFSSIFIHFHPFSSMCQYIYENRWSTDESIEYECMYQISYKFANPLNRLTYC
jgi:hypothetical protein